MDALYQLSYRGKKSRLILLFSTPKARRNGGLSGQKRLQWLISDLLFWRAEKSCEKGYDTDTKVKVVVHGIHVKKPENVTVSQKA